MANLWKHAGNVLLIFLLTLGADPACHHKYLAVEKTRDFVQLCLESDSKLILEALPGTLHIFGKQKIFRGSPVFIMHEIVMGGDKGSLWLTQKKRGIGAFAGIEQIIPGLSFVYFSPGTWIFMWEKIISELFIIYLFIIPSSVPHTMGDQLPVGSVNGPGGSWGKGLCPEHAPGLGNTAAVGWDPPSATTGHMVLPGRAQPPWSPLLCSCSKWMIRHGESWLLLLIHRLHDLDEIPDPKSFSLDSSQYFTSSSSKWWCVLCGSKGSALARHGNIISPSSRLLPLFFGKSPGEHWEEIPQQYFPSLA